MNGNTTNTSIDNTSIRFIIQCSIVYLRLVFGCWHIDARCYYFSFPMHTHVSTVHGQQAFFFFSHTPYQVCISLLLHRYKTELAENEMRCIWNRMMWWFHSLGHFCISHWIFFRWCQNSRKNHSAMQLFGFEWRWSTTCYIHSLEIRHLFFFSLVTSPLSSHVCFCFMRDADAIICNNFHLRLPNTQSLAKHEKRGESIGKITLEIYPIREIDIQTIHTLHFHTFSQPVLFASSSSSLFMLSMLSEKANRASNDWMKMQNKIFAHRNPGGNIELHSVWRVRRFSPEQ